MFRPGVLQSIARAPSCSASGSCSTSSSSAGASSLWLRLCGDQIPTAPSPNDPLHRSPHIRDHSTTRTRETVDPGGHRTDSLTSESGRMISQTNEMTEEDRCDQRRSKTYPREQNETRCSSCRRNSREGANHYSSENGEFGVGDKAHRTVVITLDPHLNRARHVVKSGRGLSRLTGGLCRWCSGRALNGSIRYSVKRVERLTGPIWG